MLTVYKASAGSGKTYKLTLEYIKKLLGHKDSNGTYHLNTTGKEHHRSILAITFTNKATEEMKQRIIKELAHLAGVKIDEFKDDNGNYTRSPYADELLSLFNCSEEKLQGCASKALKELLFDFTFFNVSTIDAFFQTILRTFAREAELTGNYEVHIGDDFAIKSSLAQVINDTSYNQDNNDNLLRKKLNYQRKWIKDFIRAKFEAGKSFDIYNTQSTNFRSIAKYLKDICNEDFKKHYKEINDYLSDFSNLTGFAASLKSSINSFSQQLKKSADAILSAVPCDIDLKSALGANMTSALHKLRENPPNSLSKTIKSAADSPELAKKRYNSKYYYLAGSEFDQIYLENLYKICELYSNISFYNLIGNNLHDLGLLASIMDYIEEFRKENNLILLSDTNDILKDIIADDDVPFIYERMGMLLQHYFIDEFQDTAHSQWDNLKPLVKNSMAENHDNLIIGDEKQSIYRFRGSDPELLGSEVQSDQAFAHNIDIQGVSISQNTNWRSSVEVIQFNNTIFSAIVQEKGGKPKERYSNVAQQIAKKHNDLNGYVKFMIMDKQSSLKNTNERKAKALEILGNEIDRQIGSGYKLSDIAILVNSNKEGETIIDYLLTQHQFNNLKEGTLNISSEESLKISRSSAVRIIISYLRQLDCPTDEPDNPYYTTRQRIETLIKDFEFNRHKSGDNSQALLESIENPSPYGLELKQKIAQMECATLPAIIDLIIQDLDQNTCKDQNIYISAFMDEVIDFCSTSNGDIHSFLKWWDFTGKYIGISMPDNFNAIKIMTIHKSKGLEFPCVHIPFANWDLDKKDELMWYKTIDAFPTIDNAPPYIPLKGNAIFSDTKLKSQYEEACLAAYLDNLNKTYVAFTRAVKELIIISYTHSKSNDSHIGRTIVKALDLASDDFCKQCEKALNIIQEPDRRDIFKALTPYTTTHHDEIFTTTFTLGYPTTVELKQEQINNCYSQDNYQPLAGDTYYIIPKENVGKLSSIDKIHDIYDPRQRGIIMHNILSLVRTKEDLDFAIKRQAYRSLIPKEETVKIKDELLREITRDDTRHWFENTIRVINERTIALSNGHRRRCDRIVWTADGHIDIIDYKTGTPTEKQKETNIEQVQNYARYMNEDGYTNLRGFLWYLDTGKIEPVPLD